MKKQNMILISIIIGVLLLVVIGVYPKSIYWYNTQSQCLVQQHYLESTGADCFEKCNNNYGDSNLWIVKCQEAPVGTTCPAHTTPADACDGNMLVKYQYYDFPNCITKSFSYDCSPQVCQNAKCVDKPIISHFTYQCDSGNVYWFNSNSVKEDIKETCTSGICNVDTCGTNPNPQPNPQPLSIVKNNNTIYYIIVGVILIGGAIILFYPKKRRR